MTKGETERIFRRNAGHDENQQRCGNAVFAARACAVNRVAVAVLGEVDAVNGRELGRFVERHTRASAQLVLDLRCVDFFGSQGFTALFYISVYCARRDVDWAIVASPPVQRLLSICDPDGELPLAADLSSALERLDRCAHHRLQFVWTGKSGWRTG